MENQVEKEYKRELKIGGVPVVAEIKSYTEPIRKTETIECFTNVEIKCGDILWGQMAFPNPTQTQEEADVLFNAIVKDPEAFRLK